MKVYSIKHKLIEIRIDDEGGFFIIWRKTPRMKAFRTIRDASNMPIMFNKSDGNLWEAIRQANLYAESFLRGKL